MRRVKLQDRDGDMCAPLVPLMPFKPLVPLYPCMRLGVSWLVRIHCNWQDHSAGQVAIARDKGYMTMLCALRTIAIPKNDLRHLSTPRLLGYCT